MLRFGLSTILHCLVNITEYARAQPDNEARIQNALSKARAWFVSTPESHYLDVWLVHDYMRRKFGENFIPWALDSLDALSDKAQNDTTSKGRILKTLAILWNPQKAKYDLPKNKPDYGDTDVMISQAAWCKSRKPTPGLYKILDTLSSYDKYFCTHAYLAVNIAMENECSPKNKYRLYRDKLKKILLGYLNASEFYDLEIETMALLGCFDREVLTPEHLSKALKTQHADGSWMSLDPSSSNEILDKRLIGHTTILAIWALLEYSAENKRKIKWVN